MKHLSAGEVQSQCWISILLKRYKILFEVSLPLVLQTLNQLERSWQAKINTLRLCDNFKAELSRSLLTPLISSVLLIATKYITCHQQKRGYFIQTLQFFLFTNLGRWHQQDLLSSFVNLEIYRTTLLFDSIFFLFFFLHTCSKAAWQKRP